MKEKIPTHWGLGKEKVQEQTALRLAEQLEERGVISREELNDFKLKQARKTNKLT